MRTNTEYDKVMELKSQGKNNSEIAYLLNIPRRTIIDWIKKKPNYFHSNPKTNATFTEQDFIQAVKECFSKSAVIKKLGLFVGGTNYRMFDDKIKQLKLDTSHFTGSGHLKGRTHIWNRQFTNDDLFTSNSQRKTSVIRKRIKRDNLIVYECSICQNKGNWLDKKLTLHLDHINGINNDNRLENLRWLCPNCHSQTQTYCKKKCTFGEI